MSNAVDIQLEFFQIIKDKIPKGVSLVDELAELLHVSTDSAYRRMRGETNLSFDEIGVIARRFNVSLDGFLDTKGDSVSFDYKSIRKELLILEIIYPLYWMT